MLIGYTGDIGRFANRDHYAAYNGTAPVEFSSGGRTVHRLSQRGNRQLNHALHMAAICQLRQPHSEGRAYFDRKVAEGKTKREAIRSLKRHISNAVYRQLVADARRARAEQEGPGGQTGTTRQPARPASHPYSRLFGEVRVRAATRTGSRQQGEQVPERWKALSLSPPVIALLGVEECEASRAREARPPCTSNAAAYTDAVPVYAALGAGRVAGGRPRCHGGYFGSRLNFEADQK